MALHANFTNSVYDKNKTPSKFSIPTMLLKRGSKRHNVSDSYVVLNHLRFVVYTVDVDSLANNSTDKKKISPIDKFAISHVEVIPMR